MPQYKNSLPKRSVKQVRKLLGVTREELAHLLGISLRTLAYVESGERWFTPEVASSYQQLLIEVYEAEKLALHAESPADGPSAIEIRRWVREYYRLEASLIGLRNQLKDMEQGYEEALRTQSILLKIRMTAKDVSFYADFAEWRKDRIRRNNARLLLLGETPRFNLRVRIKGHEAEQQLIRHHLDQISPGWKK